MSTRVWITGAGGLIGRVLARHTPPAGLPAPTLIPLTRADLDLADADAVSRRFRADQPDLVLHLAGLTRSPMCQKEPALARRLNVEVTRQLVELSAGRLVFFSTDLVFDGSRGNYVESDAVHPLSVYAETKAEAERIVLAAPGAVVIRTSLNYGHSPEGDRSFNEEMLRNVRAGAKLRLFTDEFRCPIRAVDTVRITWELVAWLWATRGGRWNSVPAEIVHLAGSERLSRWDIGQLLAQVHPEFRSAIEPASLREYQGAPRSPDTSLNVGKIEAILGQSMPRFSAALTAPTPSV